MLLLSVIKQLNVIFSMLYPSNSWANKYKHYYCGSNFRWTDDFWRNGHGQIMD